MFSCCGREDVSFSSLSVSKPQSGQYEGTNLETVAAPGSAAPERLQEEGWAGGLPGTAGLWPESDPAGSSSDRLKTETGHHFVSEGHVMHLFLKGKLLLYALYCMYIQYIKHTGPPQDTLKF